MEKTARNILAIDLGATSGRAVLGTLEGNILRTREIHRFPNGPVERRGGIFWDVEQLHGEILNALRRVADENIPLESMGVDTWGVDYGLVDPGGGLLAPPRSYRDPRTLGIMDDFFERVPRKRVYELTGIQFLQINTLYQLVAENRVLLGKARALLFMPDLFAYFLTGERATEFTVATTSQMYNLVKGEWENELLEATGLPHGLLSRVLAPGSLLGELSPETRKASGLGPVKYVLPAAHDTGSAVVAIPMRGESPAYVSSGTWSLVGIETTRPIINDLALEKNFTNEGGPAGTFRFLKNISGMWLLEKCLETWGRSEKTDYRALFKSAEKAEPFKSIINPDDPSFLNPQDMPEAISTFCVRTNQPAPASKAAFVRCILESLALKYAITIQELNLFAEKPVDRVHVVGGGARNETLCRFTAAASGLPVYAGPVEATAIGNVLVQAMGLGLVSTLAEAREIVAASLPVREYEPAGEISDWIEALAFAQTL